MARRWTDEEIAAVAEHTANEDWPAFHALFPHIPYDAWEVKRRRVQKTLQAEAAVADAEAEVALIAAHAPRAPMPRADERPHLGAPIEIPENVNFRIGFWDIETTGLKANFGRILCSSVADADGTVHTLRADYPELVGVTKRDDSKLAAAIRDQLEEYDLLVTWNGKRYDMRYLNGRLMLGNERPIRADLMHIDGLYISRHYLAWASHRLDAVAKTLRLPSQKTDIEFEAWEAAKDGETWALDYVEEHNVADVLVTRAMFWRYRKLIKVVHR